MSILIISIIIINSENEMKQMMQRPPQKLLLVQESPEEELKVYVLYFLLSDGEEGQEDDEELPEGHEPPGQEGRIRPARVRPQTQTPPGREEEVRHHRQQINNKSQLLLLDCQCFGETTLCIQMFSFISFPPPQHRQQETYQTFGRIYHLWEAQ